MEKAIEHAGITKESVDYINTHGTSTGMGDPIETNAIAELFSEHAGEMAVTSTKGATGHMMGCRRYHRGNYLYPVYSHRCCSTNIKSG